MLTIKKKNIFLSFSIGKELFAVSTEKVIEVLDNQSITKVPNAPYFVQGVINFRGLIIPVIDARLKFNLPGGGKEEGYVMIIFNLNIHAKNVVIGAIVDKLQNAVSFDESEILTFPELGLNYNTGFIFGMIKNEKKYIVILDMDKVFSIEELITIQELKEENIAVPIEVVI